MRWPRQKWMKRQVFKIFFLSILTILLLVGIYTFFFTIPLVRQTRSFRSSHTIIPVNLETKLQFWISLNDAPELRIEASVSKPKSELSLATSKNSTKLCGMHSCFDIYRCGKLGENKLSVYVYPVKKIIIHGRPLQESFSKEFYEIIDTIIQSPYYVSDPNQACIFVPTIDLLNIQSFLSSSSQSQITMEDVSQALKSLELYGLKLFTIFSNSIYHWWKWITIKIFFISKLGIVGGLTEPTIYCSQCFPGVNL